MKLEKYLANYLVKEIKKGKAIKPHHGQEGLFTYNPSQLQEIIKQSIETFESTEGVKVLVVDEENNLLNASKDFLTGWLHFCNCIDFRHSNLDAKAIRFMNEIPGKIQQAVKGVK